ncbi:hypothetical protein D7044_09050 [Micromonospora musae]|uniref:Uncharacterized protein n=1 Tax=Micromonospora musae TaxID=1894970 RepID=A0A3A9Y8D1_9ACTN|nr:hypothetical protein D7044_09050 [Micromonospora musae]
MATAGQSLRWTSDEDEAYATGNQVSSATGLPRGALVMPVTSHELYGDDLTLGVGEGQVLYRVVPRDSTWRTAYNTQYAGLGRV